jgi:hypothetical protein
MVRRALFYMDGSLIDRCAGFAIHQICVGGFEHKIKGRLVFSLLKLVPFSLFYDTLLRLNGLVA